MANAIAKRGDLVWVHRRSTSVAALSFEPHHHDYWQPGKVTSVTRTGLVKEYDAPATWGPVRFTQQIERVQKVEGSPVPIVSKDAVDVEAVLNAWIQIDHDALKTLDEVRTFTMPFRKGILYRGKAQT